MKISTSLFLFFSLSCGALAFESAQLEGKQAVAMLKALRGTGSEIDCGMGRCGTTVSEVSCQRIKQQKNGSSCLLQIQNEQGGQSFKRLKGAPAAALMDALVNQGIAVCDKQSCHNFIKMISCTFSNHSENENEEVECAMN